LTGQIPDILARIVAVKRERLAEVSVATPLAELERQAETMRAERRDFARALRAQAPAFIAEIKRASPSKGVLAEAVNPQARAAEYERGGAAALSVLTEESFFRGSLADLVDARFASSIPVLRKDFTIDPFDIVEAAAHGADAILLIAAILGDSELRDFRESAAAYGMAALVEVHDAGELERALESGAEIVGVNNRDLRSFEVHLETSLDLAARMPEAVLKVSESGIRNAGDVARLRAAGFQAFLVGEQLMRAADPASELRALAGRP
jgi:indole-3-glycerol phosphate synthase